MKSFYLLGLVGLAFCFVSVLILIGIGGILSLIFPLSIFQSTLLLLALFCILLVIVPLLLINQKMEQMLFMADDDYYFGEEDQKNIKINTEGKRNLPKKKPKIIVMENSPIFDKNAPCPCGSGEKYKNCCGKKGNTNN